jgi:UDP-N-acetylglucosamine diphosphorylase/glucosamine-1-phosphate N-acetyltransferase
MSIVLFDNISRKNLYPLNNARASADLLLGILTTKERWQLLLKQETYIHTEEYLSVLYKSIPNRSHIWIDAAVLPNDDLADRILSLNDNEALADDTGLIAGKNKLDISLFPGTDPLTNFETIYECNDAVRLVYAWDLFEFNDAVLRRDFELITNGRKSQPLPKEGHYVNPENIFVEEGASISYATINASTGPVYIGENAVIMEGTFIRGPFAMCKDSVVKMGAKIYGSTTLGPCCVAGGEIKNTVMQGYSNKSHDGYIGDAVIGRWCNLGAGTSNSNIKNTGSVVKMWNSVAQDYIEAKIKCGVVMGDYSRTAINTSINTGSVIGTCCNIFGEGLLPKYIPDFQWGGKGITRYELEKSFKDIDNWKKMKAQSLTDAEKKVLQYIFETT